ncbi:MAG: amidohydrolase [Spirochaetaceae bacterium]|jgi:cytosine/adenosine deaminase-related metal-dependent hydrolase|nr:amidohydrolase [Spirochaetaceae bacterium]
MDYLIKNVFILTMNEAMDVYPNGYIGIEGDTITVLGHGDGDAVLRRSGIENGGKNAEGWKKRAGPEVIDGRGAIAVPGFINAHTHAGMIPFRSLGDDCPDRLRRFLFPLELQAMTPGLVYASTRYACAEMLLAGITCFVDMYYFEDMAALAVQEMGMRAFLGETVIGEPSCDSPEPYGSLALGEMFIQKWKDDELITPMIAPHATNTNSPEKIKEAATLARRHGVPLTMHVSEMDYEMAHFRETYGQSPIAFLESLGILGPDVIAAHCIHVDAQDIRLLSRNKTAVVHCIGANTKSAKGVAPVKAMREAGVPVALGTDGPASGNTLDMFTQFDLFAKFHKTANADRALFPAETIVPLATSGAAKALNRYHLIGSLEPGKKADVTLVETASVNMFPRFDPYSVLVYSAKAANVDTVFVNGRPLVRNKRLTRSSLDKLQSSLAEAMTDFIKEAQKRREQRQ